MESGAIHLVFLLTKTYAFSKKLKSEITNKINISVCDRVINAMTSFNQYEESICFTVRQEVARSVRKNGM